jgi:hypothetical protein
MNNSSKNLPTKQGNIGLGKNRLTMLKDIYEVHKVKHPTVVAVSLRRSIAAAVAPG